MGNHATQGKHALPLLVWPHLFTPWSNPHSNVDVDVRPSLQIPEVLRFMKKGFY